MTLSQRGFLEQNASLRGDETAVRSVDEDETWTYAELDALVNQLANALRDRGLRSGDRIALVLRNTVEYPVAMYACHKLGAIAIPVNYRLSTGEIRAIFDDANVAAVVYDDAFADNVQPAAAETLQPTATICVGSSPDDGEAYRALIDSGSRDAPPELDREPSDPSYFIYTSGTTGRAKGVVQTVASARERTLAAIVSFDVDPDSVVLSQLPFFHGGGLDAGLRAAMTAGAELVVSSEYANPGRSLETVQVHDVTHIIGIPTVTRRIIETLDVDAYDLSSVECWYHTGEVMREERARRFQAELTPNVINSYGSSEGGFVTVLRSDALTEQAGTVGRPTLVTEIRIVDLDADGQARPTDTVSQGEEGEVIIRSEQLFAQYFGNATATSASFQDGWYYTNDLGYLNEAGYLTITGRVDDVVVSGGELIAPAEVEEVLEHHEGVHEAVVVGEPDDDWGERVVAIVDGREGISAEELDQFCRDGEQLAEYKRPRRYEFVDGIEHTESGKKVRSRYRPQ